MSQCPYRSSPGIFVKNEDVLHCRDLSSFVHSCPQCPHDVLGHPVDSGLGMGCSWD